MISPHSVSSLGNDPILRHFDFIHTAKRKEELHQVPGGILETWPRVMPCCTAVPFTPNTAHTSGPFPHSVRPMHTETRETEH